MSTHAEIKLVQGKDSIRIYQHSDGYPSWTIPAIQRFLKWNDDRNDNLLYSVANFVTFFKIENVLNWMEHAKDDPKSEYSKKFEELFPNASSNFSAFHTGYGIVPDKVEIDAHWEYIVNLDTKTIEIVGEDITIPFGKQITRNQLEKIEA